MVKSLTELLKKNTTFNWTPIYQQSPDTIKVALTKSPILTFPDLTEPYVLFTYASRHSLSRVLIQECITTMTGKDTKSFLPIMYVGGTFCGTKEAYTIYMTFKKYSYYFYDVKVPIKCYHSPLHKFFTAHTIPQYMQK